MGIFKKTANDLTPRNEGQGHSQPAFEVAHLAAGGSQVKDASGGPAGGQTFEKFDKQVFMVHPINSCLKADVICPEERGAKHIRNLLSRWHTLPPEACFPQHFNHRRQAFRLSSIFSQEIGR